jgi:arginyl-tRNA synthetase
VSIEQELSEWLREGLRAAASRLDLDPASLPEPEILAPKQKEHGDFATNVALALAKPAGRPPREVAEILVEALAPAPFLERVEVAGPGFLNVFTTDAWLHDALREIAARGDAYGRAAPRGRRIQVEFVSANPTGPLHVGHARNAALGDALARLLEAAGWQVEREYYFNDAGRQMDLFGSSVAARYLQVLGRDAELPEDGYGGDYVTALAREIVAEHGDALADLRAAERDATLLAEGTRRILEQNAATLARFGVRFDSYFSEAELERRGEISAAVQRLREADVVYEAEGATWFRSTGFGDDKDRVLIRSNGQHTYFGADCAYLVDKFSRGFDRVLYVWGADHHGDVVRVRGAAGAMGYDADAVEILLYQFVAFLRGGEAMKMSKRAGTIVTLDELIDEVGADAARFTLLSSSSDSAMNFDIEAVKRQTMDNPVYYVQYGHARIASVLRRAQERGVALRPIDEADLGLLRHETELDLLRALAELPDVVATAADLRAPHRVTHAVQDLAARFHRFYTECQVVDPEAPALTQARLWLCAGTKRGIANLLELLGVGAPESMTREDEEQEPTPTADAHG